MRKHPPTDFAVTITPDLTGESSRLRPGRSEKILEVRWKIKTGRFDTVIPRIRRSVAWYAQQSSYFKIGITGDPEDRADRYEQDGDGYDEMVVLYEASSENYVRDAEFILVDDFWEHEGCDNLASGGGGPVSGPPYFLYLVRTTD